MSTETNEINLDVSSYDSVDKSIYFYNIVEGNLNESDGIECQVCLNKGKVAFRKNEALYLRNCQCKVKRDALINARQSNMEGLLELSLDNYICNNIWQQSLKETAQRYIDSDHLKWFAILGQSGCGKTHICSSICNALLQKNKAVKYVIWNDLVKEIKQAIHESSDNSILYNLSRVEVLYIDDLFKGGYTQADIRYAFEILNARVNQKLTTIISSELSLKDIYEIDVAIAGRIKQMTAEYLIQIEKDASKNFRFQ